jgi:hypothetical protein
MMSIKSNTVVLFLPFFQDVSQGPLNIEEWGTHEAVPKEGVLVYVWLASLSIIGCIGNSIVLHVYRRMRVKPSSVIFIMTLTCMDLVSSWFLMPSSIYFSYIYHCVYPSQEQHLNMSTVDHECYTILLPSNFQVLLAYKSLYNWLLWVSNYFSIMLLANIAFDRYLAVSRPRHFQNHSQRPKVAIIISIIISMILAAPYFSEVFLWSICTEDHDQQAAQNFCPNMEQLVDIFTYVSDTIISFLVIITVVFYILVFKNIYFYNRSIRHRGQLQRAHIQSSDEQRTESTTPSYRPEGKTKTKLNLRYSSPPKGADSPNNVVSEVNVNSKPEVLEVIVSSEVATMGPGPLSLTVDSLESGYTPTPTTISTVCFFKDSASPQPQRHVPDVTSQTLGVQASAKVEALKEEKTKLLPNPNQHSTPAVKQPTCWFEPKKEQNGTTPEIQESVRVLPRLISEAAEVVLSREPLCKNSQPHMTTPNVSTSSGAGVVCFASHAFGMRRGRCQGRQPTSVTGTAQMNTLATLILVTVVGIITWIPFLLQYHGLIEHNLTNKYSYYFASAMNPIIYSVFNTRFREEAKKLCQVYTRSATQNSIGWS